MARRANHRAEHSPPVARPAVRCAIYTRKSTDEGLDRDFNSLDAQREACEAFVHSQRGEGWILLDQHYDDGGFSGATTNRPALQRLITDAERGLLDCVVIYKLDRLSRCVRDYLNLLAFLEEHQVAFVSVTQQFNTTTPIGRMTLRMLLSFAEFERDLVSERTRDKMSAARRRGKWTGGMPPLGFDVAAEGGRLVTNRDEADQVRAIFDLYVEKRSLIDVAAELNRRGWRRKSWTTRDGKLRVGKAWDKTNLHKMLTDPVYAGMQKLRGQTFPGQHPAIVTKAVFRQVQDILAGNRSSGGALQRNDGAALLRGLLRCAACDAPMIHSWTTKNGRRYRYYTCTVAQKSGAASCPTRSVRAEAIERFVVDKIRVIGSDPKLQDAIAAEAQSQVAAERKALTAEQKRLDLDRRDARAKTKDLVAALAKAEGDAAEAVSNELGAAQARVATLDARAAEVADRLDTLRSSEIDRADLAAALAAFDPVWDALLVPERERVLRLLIRSVTYDGGTEQLALDFHPLGITTLAAEIASEKVG